MNNKIFTRTMDALDFSTVALSTFDWEKRKERNSIRSEDCVILFYCLIFTMLLFPFSLFFFPQSNFWILSLFPNQIQRHAR